LTNNQEQPIMVSIDKLLCNGSFEQQYPLSFVTSKSRAGSDHVPLVINFGIDEPKKQSVFRFEKWWLNHPGFKEFVIKTWNTDCIFTEPIEIWQFKIRLLRKKLKDGLEMLMLRLGNSKMTSLRSMTF
jgi:hypothetical protein